MERPLRAPALFYLLLLPFLYFLMASSSAAASAMPLHTHSRWIVDGAGERVKLACVNWVSHLEGVVAEGLSKQPVDAISRRIAAMGFNCVRLTWPLFLATNESLANLTVRQSFNNLGLAETIVGIRANNPAIVDLSLRNAFKAVVASLADNNVMVILDNHISVPGWCCSGGDGSGFFGDRYFNPDVWLAGLTRMATMFNGITNVVGMSLRNELRGPKQNTTDWYRYMLKGAEAVHAANQDVLVILSGLDYDTRLSFLEKQPVNLTFSGKLVFELHWYGFSDGKAWESGNPNEVCGRVTASVMQRAGFLLEQGWPLFISEFGVDQRGTNVNDNRYLNCFLSVAAELDWDWALWTLVGSYYFREGVTGMEEFYGLLTWNWCAIRNETFANKISAYQAPFQGPGASESRVHKVLFHPSTGQCVLRQSAFGPLKLGPCSDSDAWSYTPQKQLTIEGTYFCLQADGLGEPTKLGIICSNPASKWNAISDSKMHLSPDLSDGTQLCLDVDSCGTLITNACKCLSKDSSCDPSSQWFKTITRTRRVKKHKFSVPINTLLELIG